MKAFLRRSVRGQGLVEYALILVLVAIIAIVILAVAGKTVAERMCDVVIQLGGNASDSIQACRAPRVTLSGNYTNPLNIEATIKNNKGEMKSGVTVDFWLDGVDVTTEHSYRYCLGTGDASCSDYATTLSHVPHTLRVVATDTSTGLTGETSVTFTP